MRPTPITTGLRCWPRWDPSWAGGSWTEPAVPGLNLRELLERRDKVTAFLTPAQSWWPLAGHRTADRVRTDQAAFGEPLPYPDGAFDLIVCALANHYASNRAAAFA